MVSGHDATQCSDGARSSILVQEDLFVDVVDPDRRRRAKHERPRVQPPDPRIVLTGWTRQRGDQRAVGRQDLEECAETARVIPHACDLDGEEQRELWIGLREAERLHRKPLEVGLEPLCFGLPSRSLGIVQRISCECRLFVGPRRLCVGQVSLGLRLLFRIASALAEEERDGTRYQRQHRDDGGDGNESPEPAKPATLCRFLRRARFDRGLQEGRLEVGQLRCAAIGPGFDELQPAPSIDLIGRATARLPVLRRGGQVSSETKAVAVLVEPRPQPCPHPDDRLVSDLDGWLARRRITVEGEQPR